jgi:hypothetical protein
MSATSNVLRFVVCHPFFCPNWTYTNSTFYPPSSTHHEGAVLLMTLLCLCIYIIHRRRPSRSRAPLTQTLTTGTYSLAHLGPGLGPTRKEKTLGSTEKKPLFGGKFGSSSGKRRGGESGATDQEQPSYDLGDSDLNSPVVRAPEGPPPLYFYGDRDLAGGAEQPFKYDPVCLLVIV